MIKIKNYMIAFCTLALFILIPVQALHASSANEQETYYVNTAKGLNVRSGPSTDYDVLGILPSGAEVDVLDKTEGGWYKIDFEGESGYVYQTYLSIVESKQTEAVSQENTTLDSTPFIANHIVIILLLVIILVFGLILYTIRSFFSKQSDSDYDDEYDDDGYDDESYEDEVYDDESYDNESYDDNSYNDTSYDDESCDDEVYDDESHDNY